MNDTELLDLLLHIAQKGYAPGPFSSRRVEQLGALVHHHGWPQMSLTPAGWTEFDRLTAAQSKAA
jgi:hypothetical protein